ncbi:hypothetical protein, partial [Nitrosomonas sp. ANs5]|uniref:hypothetical protein n=1 Tax=Nitrosomonas sp. ANs5 TaxID=3423941 RepID=UPI003D358540
LVLTAWRAKNVTPVLYDATQSHRLLHQSLHVWSSIYRDGVRGKERLVTRYARRNPKETSTHDDFVGRLLWALSDPDGLPARRFADLDPVPSLDWLELLSKERYRHTDLGRFGVPPKAVHDDKLAFSLLRRPSPYPLAPRMSIVDAGRWDEVMQQLAYWLIRHLDDPALLLWLVKDYGELHDKFVLLLDNRLDYLAKLERDGNTAKLARIRASASNAIPGPLMRTLWRLLLTGRVKSRVPNLDLYRWRSHLQRDGFTTTLRLELRELLVPRVLLREPFRWTIAGNENAQPERIKDLVEWEIVLFANHVRSGLRDLSKDKHWNTALPELLFDFSMLLRDAFDLMRELGGAVDKHDLSYTYRPSISEHPQNADRHDWTVLIDLTLDAWIATAAQSPARAALVAESWWHTPYPLFRRLAFFAAAQDNVISHRQALDWLLADDHWWLWSVETQREAMRLLVALAPQLDGAMLAELEQAILAGPPRAMFKADIAPERWSQIVDHKVWLRLAKIVETGAVLSAAGKEQLGALSAQYPESKPAVDQRDEFPLWREDGSELQQFNATPHRRRDLIEWLRQHPSTDHFKENDDWQQRCRDHFATTACALCGLAREGFWPTARWQEALQAWSEKKLLKRSWRYLAPILNHAPDELLQSHGISWWLHAVAKVLETHETILFALSKRILEFDYEIDTDAGEPVMRAINHQTGLVTEALLHWWFRKTPEDEQGLPDQLRPIFTTLCDTKVDKFRHGRVLLAMHVIALFRVDRDWTMQYLLPLFDWQHSKEEARAAWSGFLSALRLYRPLMEVLKPQFLDTARHYAALDKYAGQYASLLTFAALDPGDTFTVAELADTTRALPPDGLHEAARALVRTLESAGEQRADYWTNRVVPYLNHIWPKSRQHASAAISDALGRLCIAAKDAFPEAMLLLHPWLQPPEYPDFLTHEFNQAGLCSKFPKQALDFLNLVIGELTQWPPGDLSACLKAIRNEMPALESDDRFIRLSNYLRKQGIDI